MKYLFHGDETDASDIMFAAELAHKGGLLEEMPADVDEAIDAFGAIGIDIEEVA